MNPRLRDALALLAVLAVVLVPACVGAAGAASADVATQFAAAMQAAPSGQGDALAAGLAADPLPPQVLTDGACRVTIGGHLGAVQTRDGSWIVQVPLSGAQVLEHTGGAALNVRGTNTTDVHTASLALPAAVVPCDALVVATPGTGRGDYWAAPGRSSCSEAMAVVFVPYAVRGDLLRPPAIGSSWLSRYFRSVPIPERAVHVETLPTALVVSSLPVNWQAWGAAEPTIPYLTGLLRRFAGECYDGWSTDTRTPDRQHPGYGSAYASVVSQALVQLCSTSSAEAKRPLALAVVQRGLDLVGAFADGRRQFALGGHCAGRKALVIACGHLLGVEALADPAAVVGPVFQEDQAYQPGDWWFGGWKARWGYRGEAPGDGSLLGAPPGQWGAVDSTTHSSWAWMVSGYLPQVVGAQVGTAYAMRKLGRTGEWSTSADAMVAQWMEGPPPAARQQLQAAGLALPWSTDYALVRGAGFCAAAWRHQ